MHFQNFWYHVSWFHAFSSAMISQPTYTHRWLFDNMYLSKQYALASWAQMSTEERERSVYYFMNLPASFSVANDDIRRLLLEQMAVMTLTEMRAAADLIK